MPTRVLNPKEICIILTYRCNAKCNMCNVWLHPTKVEDEISINEINKLPSGLRFINITGGEPFIRRDIEEIIDVIRPKTNRIVISTNGFFTERIVRLCEKYPDLGIRISTEGLQKSNDTIRKIPGGFDRTLRTLLTLRRMGVKDIGFGMTVQDMNCNDLMPLYEMSDALGYEFATATLHNSHYFHKLDNTIENKEKVSMEFKILIRELLKSKSVKKWFRAYFNYGLINYIQGRKRLLPCEMGVESCFVDPSGDIIACNGMGAKVPMGNIKNKSFDEIWRSQEAERVRSIVKTCDRQCWMVGNAVPVIKKYIYKPMGWIIQNKLRVMFNRDLSCNCG
ncbi:radical SAM protein [candidate division WS5 bacterium]|uniref:Radical SAM protein n=1 Tax=candidate division WS5 bacterium TaxID=2093353 RepID=A0A419DDY8_9BACT|nr:MAG: radical SAM protein [candidate division WS5 bacterium]